MTDDKQNVVELDRKFGRCRNVVERNESATLERLVECAKELLHRVSMVLACPAGESCWPGGVLLLLWENIPVPYHRGSPVAHHARAPSGGTQPPHLDIGVARGSAPRGGGRANFDCNITHLREVENMPRTCH